MTFLCAFCWRMAWLSSLLAILLEWLCHSVWLFHLHSTVKRQPFSPVFPLAESKVRAFCRLFLWNFKKKHQPFSMAQPLKKGSTSPPNFQALPARIHPPKNYRTRHTPTARATPEASRPEATQNRERISWASRNPHRPV